MLKSVLTLLVFTLAVLPACGQEKPKPPTPDEALKLLKEGNARFVKDKQKGKTIDEFQWLELGQKQEPFAIVLSCADSRVVPSLVFDKTLGEIFTLSVAGNVGGPAIVASMEYAVAVLNVPLIVVVGHTSCGAVEAALSGKELPSENLKHLVEMIHVGTPPKDAKDKAAVLDAAIRANILYQTQRLTKDSKILKEFADAKRIKIVPAKFTFKSGEVEWLELPKEGK